MFTLTEYAFWGAASNPNGGGPRFQLASTSLAPAAGAANIAALNANTRVIVLCTSVDSRVDLTGPAGNNSMPVFAKVPFILHVKGGETVSIRTF